MLQECTALEELQECTALQEQWIFEHTWETAVMSWQHRRKQQGPGTLKAWQQHNMHTQQSRSVPRICHRDEEPDGKLQQVKATGAMEAAAAMGADRRFW